LLVLAPSLAFGLLQYLTLKQHGSEQHTFKQRAGSQIIRINIINYENVFYKNDECAT